MSKQELTCNRSSGFTFLPLTFLSPSCPFISHQAGFLVKLEWQESNFSATPAISGLLVFWFAALQSSPVPTLDSSWRDRTSVSIDLMDTSAFRGGEVRLGAETYMLDPTVGPLPSRCTVLSLSSSSVKCRGLNEIVDEDYLTPCLVNSRLKHLFPLLSPQGDSCSPGLLTLACMRWPVS